MLASNSQQDMTRVGKVSDDHVGFNFLITNNATDTDLPAQTLTYNLNTTVTHAVLDTNYRVFNWRPLVTQTNTTNEFNVVVVADNGSR